MSNINQNNFIAYLKFLESKYPQIKFSVEKLEALKKIDNQQISQYLQLVYEKFSLDKILEENAFMKFKIDEELQKILPVITPEIVEEVPKVLPVIPDVNSEQSPQNLNPKINVEPEPSVSVPKTPTATNVPPPQRIVPIDIAPKNNTIRNIFIILFLGVASYVIYEYYEYQKLGSAYALSNELLIRDSSKKDGNVLGSADLFGKNIDNNNVEIPTTSELKLYSNERQGGYYKVIVGDTPFISYLFNTNAGYVYSKFFTTDKKEQDLYKAIFEPIKDDYYELKHLEFAYRAMIVNAIKNTPTMKGLVLKESCDVQPAMAKKMPLRIGQNQNKDRTVFHALVQLSDNNYYAIIANGFYNVSQINQIYLDNEPLTQQGKFINKGKYFIWESCDKSITAKSEGQPFDVFSTDDSSEEISTNF